MQVVGIDEVGRGCWAGPLVAAAVALHPARPISGLNDSKKLSRLHRERLDTQIQAEALAVGIGWVWPTEIDAHGLTWAVGMAMRQAIDKITIKYSEIIIDGSYNFLPDYALVTTLVQADSLIPAVSAASIVAKVARDNYMTTVAATTYPSYGFDHHVGYGTSQHMLALQKYGVTSIHRKTYKPIKQYLCQSSA